MAEFYAGIGEDPPCQGRAIRVGLCSARVSVSQSTIARIARGIAWRSAWVTSLAVVRAGPRCESPMAPEGLTAARIRGTGAQQIQIATRAMQAAGDDGYGSVSSRLANGDEFFGWQSDDGTIACFCWARHRGRAIGPVPLKEHPGRVFLYNAHTLPQFRGRGLYRVLLEHMIWTFSEERQTEFIGDVDRRNTASCRALDRAGFKVVGSITLVKFFQRWDWRWRGILFDQTMAPLF